MTNKEYRKTDAISRSDLAILLKQTPFHMKYTMEHRGEEDSKALHFGRASHKYILEKDSFYNEFIQIPVCDRRTKEGKETYAKFCLECDNSGKEPIDVADLEQIKEMSAAIDAYPLARQLLTGTIEQSFFWTDSETGEKCKVRPDCITEYDGRKYIVDYKTTDSCADGAFEHSVRKYGYKFQSGMYREGVFQNTFDDYGFIFVAQEKKAPYAVRIYFCTDEFINEGYEQFRKAISTYHFCKVNDRWPCYEGFDDSVTSLVEEGDI